MTVCQPIKSDLHQASDAATREVNAWRGRCINLYARAEDCLSRELMRLAPDKPLPMLVSQKARQLRLLVGPKLVDRLDVFSGLLGQRTLLTHGCGKVWVDRDGGWLVQLTYVSKRGQEDMTLDKDAATAFAGRLHAAVQRLEAGFRT